MPGVGRGVCGQSWDRENPVVRARSSRRAASEGAAQRPTAAVPAPLSTQRAGRGPRTLRRMYYLLRSLK